MGTGRPQRAEKAFVRRRAFLKSFGQPASGDNADEEILELAPPRPLMSWLSVEIFFRSLALNFVRRLKSFRWVNVEREATLVAGLVDAQAARITMRDVSAVVNYYQDPRRSSNLFKRTNMDNFSMFVGGGVETNWGPTAASLPPPGPGLAERAQVLQEALDRQVIVAKEALQERGFWISIFQFVNPEINVGFRSSQLYDQERRPQQPFFSNSDEIEQGREAAAQFQRTPWLTPPHQEGPDSEPPLYSEQMGWDNFRATAPSAELKQEGYKALEKLMRWRSAGKAEDGLARRFAEALKALVGEFRRLVWEMVQQRFLEEGHLECLLLAFVATRGWSEELPPVSRFIQAAVQDVLQTMSPEIREKWRQFRIAEVRDSSSDIYSSVDVRAWPLICTTRPMKYQWLCQAADLLHKLRLQEEFDEAVAACEDQGMIQPGIYATFNDKMLAVNERKDVLYTVLKDLDETERKEDYELRMLHDLLDELDQDIRRCDYVRQAAAAFEFGFLYASTWVDSTGVIENEELTPAQFCDHIEDDPNYEILLRDAVNRLLSISRTFEAAKMLARPEYWISREERSFGPRFWGAAHGQLSLGHPATACPDVEAKLAILRSAWGDPERKMRRKTLGALSSEKMLEVLGSAEQEPEDSFAPLAVGSMCLPGGEEDVLRVPSTEQVNGDRVTRDAIDLLKEELLEGPPVAVGIWWLWRCFNAHIDQHSRAAVLALTYRQRNGRNRLVLIDMIAPGS
ncbi:hypothetical protein AK812_SmicGene18561 [Symbiodinium microadriaticum]|uniref:Uncharacterized protein n=1 Tax=Symbiodinium microadriaticum TaxID=2951 RepID=A0A1Q9DUV1_SYMMI|nr:hypothetical protein AK812_SmicGene18561 [Symbiodinium microadriaticum]